MLAHLVCFEVWFVYGMPYRLVVALVTSHSQVLSNSSVSSGVGVYWMFYSGGDYEPVQLPQGLPAGAAAGAAPPEGVEGLRMRPGLAMSQVGVGSRGVCTLVACTGLAAFLLQQGILALQGDAAA